MVFVPKLNFLLLYFFLDKRSQLKSFFDFVDRKEWFLDQKIELLKSANHEHFPEKIIHGFCPKIKLFLITFFLGENKSVKILDWKEWFFDQKIEVLKSAKNGFFSMGLVHCFCQKIELLVIWVFWNNQVRNGGFLIFWVEKKDF